MTLWDALRTEWDATRSVSVTFGRSDCGRYTFGATSYFGTFYNPEVRPPRRDARHGAQALRERGDRGPRHPPPPWTLQVHLMVATCG